MYHLCTFFTSYLDLKIDIHPVIHASLPHTHTHPLAYTHITDMRTIHTYTQPYVISCMHRFTMVWAMGSLCASHFYRMMTDYGGWHLDFTG